MGVFIRVGLIIITQSINCSCRYCNSYYIHAELFSHLRTDIESWYTVSGKNKRQLQSFILTLHIALFTLLFYIAISVFVCKSSVL